MQNIKYYKILAILINILILTLFITKTSVYGVPENDDGISVGEQIPPTKPPVTQQKQPETETTTEDTEKDTKQEIIEQNEPDTEETPDEIIIDSLPDPVYYTISFDLNGGTGTVPNISILAGQPIMSLSQNVYKDGYDFLGWYYNNQKVTVDTNVYGDMTLTAQWQVNGTTPYTIIQKTQKLNGSYTIHNTIEKTTDAHTTITITPDPITGFTTPDSQELYIEPNGESTVTFEYKRNTYKINLKTNTGIISKQKTFSYQYEEPVSLNISLQEDYTNLKITGDVREKKFKMPAKNINITASAEPKTYKIKYKGFGIDTNDLTQTYSIETLPVTLEKPKQTNNFWTFHEWTYDRKSITEITDTSHTDMIIKATMTPKIEYIIILCILVLLLCQILYYLHKIYKRRKKHAIMDIHGRKSVSSDTRSE